MTTTTQAPILISAETGPSPACKNARVAHCCDIWNRVFQTTFAKEGYDYSARAAASKAYRNALPALSGYENICDFVACVAQGILIEAINEGQGSKLLYAAQVALSTVRLHPKAQQAEAA